MSAKPKSSVFFAASGLLVTGRSVGLTLITPGEEVQLDPARDSLLTNTIETGLAQTYAWAAGASQRSASLDLAVWRAQWAAAGYAALIGSQQQGAMGSIAIEQMTPAMLNGAMSAAAGT